MKNTVKEFLRKCQFPFLMVFATAPVPLFLYAAFAPELLHFCWVMPLVYILFVISSFFISGKHRLVYGIISAVLLLAFGSSFLLIVPSPFLTAIPVLYSLLLLWYLPMAGWSSGKELPVFWYWSGILTHTIAQFFKFLLQVNGNTQLSITQPWLLAAFFGFAILAMLSLTRGTLVDAGSGRQNPSVSMRRKNLVLTLIFFTVALLISMAPTIINAIRSFFSWLSDWILQLLESVQTPSVSETVDTRPTMSGSEKIVLGTPAENSIWTDIFNMIFCILSYTLTTVLLIIFVHKVSKKFYKLIQNLLSDLSDYASNVSEDYEDEITDTRAAAPKRKKIRLSATDERSMPPGQRIRYRYRRLLFRHPEWSKGSTARENLPNQAASLYEKARYSDHIITEEDAASFAANTKRV